MTVLLKVKKFAVTNKMEQHGEFVGDKGTDVRAESPSTPGIIKSQSVLIDKIVDVDKRTATGSHACLTYNKKSFSPTSSSSTRFDLFKSADDILLDVDQMNVLKEDIAAGKSFVTDHQEGSSSDDSDFCQLKNDEGTTAPKRLSMGTGFHNRRENFSANPYILSQAVDEDGMEDQQDSQCSQTSMSSFLNDEEIQLSESQQGLYMRSLRDDDKELENKRLDDLDNVCAVSSSSSSSYESNSFCASDSEIEMASQGIFTQDMERAKKAIEAGDVFRRTRASVKRRQESPELELGKKKKRIRIIEESESDDSA